MNDSRSTSELIQIALTALDETVQADAVAILHFRGDREVFEAASLLCASSSPQERELGLWILGQLGIPDRTFPGESVEILLNLLAQEQSPEVLCSTGIALGHLQSEKAVPALVALKNHTHKDVRFGVVKGLLCQDSEQAIQALIELSSDRDWDVRNWATFGLGSMVDIDTEKIRDALFQRLIHEAAGEGDEIYGEALVGLAERKDARLIPLLLKELRSDCVGRLAVEAASIMGDSRLYSALIRLRDRWDLDRELLEGAIERSAYPAVEGQE